MIRIIVEIGLNHLGSEERASRMLECVAAAGADAVTFQIREAKFYESDEAARGRLSQEYYRRAIEAAHRHGMEFGIAIADEAAVAGFHALGVDFWKSLSWDFKNRALRAALAATGRTVLMSTGLSGMEEIVEQSALGGAIELIHTQLSQKIEEVNLKAIAEMRRLTGLPVAFGLHCSDHDVLKTALGFEPSALLFYIKEEGSSPLFDDEHALGMADLGDAIAELKSLSLAIGTGRKSAAEKPVWVAH